LPCNCTLFKRAMAGSKEVGFEQMTLVPVKA